LRQELRILLEIAYCNPSTIRSRPPRRRVLSSTRAILGKIEQNMAPAASLPEIPLPPGIRSRYLENVNGLRVHILEAGFETPDRPCLLLLHGFPELAFCWRRVMPALAEAGYHVIAPDQRGYGRTTGWDPDYDGDLAPFRMINLVRDALGVVSALGYRTVNAVVGHDFGSPVAGWCALLRPDIFRSIALMSAPFAGPPVLKPSRPRLEDPALRELASLPRPRKHYHQYYSSREANADMLFAPQGLHNFLRAYYHHKSADFGDAEPHPLKAWSAHELATLPTHYVMDLNKDMAETVAEHMPPAASIQSNSWLSEADLSFCAAEFARTGFQGGAAVVSLWDLGQVQRGTANLVRPHHRRPVRLHFRQAGLGDLSTPRRLRGHAVQGLHPNSLTSSTVRGTGCSRSSLPRSRACCSHSCKRRHRPIRVERSSR
jgi:pimeloyl-ACP methyl ester carboxylesterase